MGWLRSQGAITTICDYRESAEQLRDEALAKALQSLRNGQPAEETLDFLAHTLTNKLIHTPSTQIRQAGINERHDLVAAARELFKLKGNK